MKLTNLISNLSFTFGFVLMLSDSDDLAILTLIKLLGIALICSSVTLLSHRKKA